MEQILKRIAFIASAVIIALSIFAVTVAVQNRKARPPMPAAEKMKY
jgi:hypothetical protein